MALSRKLFLGCTTVGLGVPLLTLGGGLLWTVRTFGGDSQRLEEERAAARREGVPLTGEDLRPKIPVPDAENAAIPIRQVMTLWPENKRRQDERSLDAGRKDTATAAERTAAKATLAKLTPILTLAHDAANRADCDFGYDFNKGAALLLPELAPMRAMARLLCTEAALTDSPEKAFAIIEDVARLARHAGKAPILICGLVQVAISSMAHKQFSLSLARFGAPALPDSPANRQYARKALKAWGDLPPLTQFMSGECVFYHVTAQQLLNGKTTFKELNSGISGLQEENGLTSIAANPPVVGPMVMRAWATRGLVYWRGAFKLMRENEGNPTQAHKAFLAYNQQWEEGTTQKRDLNNILLAVMTPVYTQAIDKFYLQTLAEQRLRETMIALLDANDDVPLPPDPFSPNNAPLGFRREGAAFTLWSIGQDRIDNDGALDKDNKVKDLVVTYPG